MYDLEMKAMLNFSLNCTQCQKRDALINFNTFICNLQSLTKEEGIRQANQDIHTKFEATLARNLIAVGKIRFSLVTTILICPCVHL